MADNPALASGENATVIIATSVGEEYLFVQEEAIEKKKNSWNAADIEIEVTPEVTPKMKTILPGFVFKLYFYQALIHVNFFALTSDLAVNHIEFLPQGTFSEFNSS